MTSGHARHAGETWGWTVVRIRGMGRGVAAFVALAVAGGAGALNGCTVQPADGNGGQRSPVRVELPDSTPSASGTSPAGPRDDDSSPDDNSSPDHAGPRDDAKPQTPTPAPVLWSSGDSGRDIRELQARLRQVAWLHDGPTGTYDDLTERAVSGFQGKRGLPRTGDTDRVTWQRLIGMTSEPGTWELYLMGGQPPDAPDPRCLTGRVLCISKSSRTLRWMIDGRTVSTTEVRFGSQYTPTREGVFHVYWKSREHWSTLYDSPMPYAMFFSGGQAVHYSADFAARGYAGASHGCVNVRDEKAVAALYAQVRSGDKVVVHW